MLFTWSSENLCIVFRQWRVTSTFSLVLSLLAIVLLTAGYECVREISRRYEQKHSAEMAAYSTSGSSMSQFPLLPEPCLIAERRTSIERIKLTPRRRKRLEGGGRKERNDHKGTAVCCASLLQLFHHVRRSAYSEISPLT